MPAPKGLGAVYLTDPDRAGRKLRAAIVRHRGDLAKAAAHLSVGRAALKKWLTRFPGGEGPNGESYATCRAWLDATYEQRNDPRKPGRRKKSAEGHANGA